MPAFSFLGKLALTASLLSVSTLACAKVPVYIFSDTPNDFVGSKIVAYVKNDISQSPNLQLVQDINSAVVSASLLGADPLRNGRVSAMSENINIVNETFPNNAWLNINQFIRICLSETAQECAKTISNDIEKVAAQYGPNLQEKLGR